MINIVFLNGYALTLGAISMSTFSIMGPHNTDLPDPFDIFPIDDTAVCFIKNVVTTPNVEVGEYTYYEDDENPTEFDRKNVLYNRPEFGDKLITASSARSVRTPSSSWAQRITAYRRCRPIPLVSLAANGQKRPVPLTT